MATFLAHGEALLGNEKSNQNKYKVRMLVKTLSVLLDSLLGYLFTGRLKRSFWSQMVSLACGRGQKHPFRAVAFRVRFRGLLRRGLRLFTAGFSMAATASNPTTSSDGMVAGGESERSGAPAYGETEEEVEEDEAGGGGVESLSGSSNWMKSREMSSSKLQKELLWWWWLSSCCG